MIFAFYAFLHSGRIMIVKSFMLLNLEAVVRVISWRWGWSTSLQQEHSVSL